MINECTVLFDILRNMEKRVIVALGDNDTVRNDINRLVII